jgi:hypothetical protein
LHSGGSRFDPDTLHHPLNSLPAPKPRRLFRYIQGMARRLFLALALLLGACTVPPPDYTPKAHQAAAVEIVWHSVYGMPAIVPAPDIGWHNQNSLTCGDYLGPGKWDAFKSPKGECVWGLSFIVGWRTEIAWPDDVAMFSRHETLAHELYHFRMYLVTGDSDHDHKDPGFEARYGHLPGGAVDLANDALLRAGL